MIVLGISSYSHESSAALIRDGRIIALAEEERFSREKHTWRYPNNAIAYCLNQAGLSMEQVDHVAFFWQPWREIYGNVTHVLKYFPESLHLLAAKSGGGEMSFATRVCAMTDVGKALQKQFSLKHTPKVNFIEHHLCHAASAFFLSPFKESAILTIDGRGESTSTLLAKGFGNKITKLQEIKVPHSLGHLYSSITQYLGFRPFFDEWKVMGMSAFGSDRHVTNFVDLLHLKSDGSYELNLKYFSFHTRGSSTWLSDLFQKRFPLPPKASQEYFQASADIAFALQRLLERAAIHLAQHLHKVTKSTNLCITGGVALNCLMNKKIIEHTPFENIFIQPIANDAGASLGAALYYHYQQPHAPRAQQMEHVYWGPEFSEFEIEGALNKFDALYTKSENIARDAAAEIADGKVLAWFQGRMESGPRALGNRSIIADPRNSKMKERLNRRVKLREEFRPFAPSVLAEKAHEYFLLPKGHSSPFMILAADVHEHKRAEIPAVTHEDGTARLHTVQKEINPRYWSLIHEFEKLTGVPVVLNTSFNENEPIVLSPEEALNCFYRTDLDVLAIGDFLVKKSK